MARALSFCHLLVLSSPKVILVSLLAEPVEWSGVVWCGVAGR